MDKIILNGKEFQCILRDGYTFSPEKLWSDETGRTYDKGKFKGRLIGIFHKIEVIVFPFNQTELQNLLTELDKDFIQAEYYLPKINSSYLGEVYAPTYQVNIKNIYDSGIFFNPITITLIATERENNV